jgi:hypothetical protein
MVFAFSSLPQAAADLIPSRYIIASIASSDSLLPQHPHPTSTLDAFSLTHFSTLHRKIELVVEVYVSNCAICKNPLYNVNSIFKR